jgi:hypothetical protein
MWLGAARVGIRNAVSREVVTDYEIIWKLSEYWRAVWSAYARTRGTGTDEEVEILRTLKTLGGKCVA